MGVCETARESDLCPPHYTSPGPPPDQGGDGPSPGDGPGPGNNGGDTGSSGSGSGGWGWPPKPGPWPQRPSGLWKSKKVRRGCGGGDAPSLKSPSSSSSSNNDNDDEHIVAVDEREKAHAGNMQKGHTTEGEIGADYAFIVPAVVQNSFLDLDSAVSASAGEDLVDKPPS